MNKKVEVFPEPEIEVEIIVRKYGEIFGKRVSYSFEGAEEDLGKLERAYNKEIEKHQDDDKKIDIDVLPKEF